MKNTLSKEALIIQCRSAFCLYLEKGIKEVEKRYPDSLLFVIENSNKSLKEVTALLTEELNIHSTTLMPLASK